MAREIVSWCDVCFNQEPPVQETGSEVVVAVGRDKLRRVDLCERHRKEIVDPLVTLLREHGVIMDSASPVVSLSSPRKSNGKKGRALNTPGGPMCPVERCAAGMGGFAHMDSLMVHTRRSHGMNRPDTEALYAAKGRPVFPMSSPSTDDDEVLQYDEPGEPIDSPLPIDDNAMTTKSALTFAEKKRVAVGMPIGETPTRPASDYVCGIDGCDKTYPPQLYNKPTQALGMHRAQKHGVMGTSKRAKNNRAARERAAAQQD